MDINDQSVEDILNVLNYLRDDAKHLSSINTELKTIYGQMSSKFDMLYDQQQRISNNMQKSLYDVVKYTHKSSLDLSSVRDTLHKFYLNTDRNLFKLLLAHKEGRQTWKEFQEFYEESQKIENQQANKQEKQTASKFKALTSSVLTKKDFIDVEGRKSKKEKLGLDYKPLTKYEKQNLRQQDMLNTKMGALLKDVQDSKKEKEGGGIMKLLGPFVLLFGGVAALAYGMMKFPLVRRLFTDLRNSRIGTSIAGFISKIKPHDKTIKEWLRGLPFIGNLFDIYDGFQQLFQGNIKQGIKHFAFAIPGAEWLANMIGSSKQQMLAPGGFQKAWQGFSLEKVWSNIKKYFNDTFIKPITSAYGSIRDAFSIMIGGSRGDITAGLMMLAEDFPSIAPVASFISKIAGKVFDVSLGELDIDKPSDWPKFDEQTIGGIFTKIYEGVSGYMSKIMDVFGQIGTFIGHFANVFSDDYGKQSAALNAIDEMSPSIGGMLRTVLGLVDNFKNAGIQEGDNAIDIVKALTSAALKGTAQSKFSRKETLKGESAALTEQIKQTTDKDEIARLRHRDEKVRAYIASQSGYDIKKAAESEKQDLYSESAMGVSAYSKKVATGAATGAAIAAPLAFIPGVGFVAIKAAAATGGVIGLGQAAADDLVERWDRLTGRYEEKWNDLNQKIKTGDQLIEYGENRLKELSQQSSLVKDDGTQIKTSLGPGMSSSPRVEAPKVVIPSASSPSSEQLMNEISKRFADQQSKLTENTKYLPELYLLLQRMYPDVAAIKETNSGMLNQGPGSVTSLIQGGTNYSFRSGDSGVSRGSLSNQWSMTK
jgi:hypothetical protein